MVKKMFKTIYVIKSKKLNVKTDKVFATYAMINQLIISICF